MTTENTVIIEGKIRTLTGKGHNRKLRANGWVPANLISKGKSTCLEINPKWLSKAWLGDKTFTLDLEGKQQIVKIQELQIHPVKRVALHVDLMPNA